MIFSLTIIFIIFLTILFLRIRHNLHNMKNYSFKEVKKRIPLKTYDFKTEKLKTEDGYIIQIVNIKHKKKFDKKLKPVLIQHGLGGSSAKWLIAGEEYSPALILAKLG